MTPTGKTPVTGAQPATRTLKVASIAAVLWHRPRPRRAQAPPHTVPRPPPPRRAQAPRPRRARVPRSRHAEGPQPHRALGPRSGRAQERPRPALAVTMPFNLRHRRRRTPSRRTLASEPQPDGGDLSDRRHHTMTQATLPPGWEDPTGSCPASDTATVYGPKTMPGHWKSRRTHALPYRRWPGQLRRSKALR